jgi:hypothetical protein
MAFALLRPNPEAVFPTQATALFAALGILRKRPRNRAGPPYGWSPSRLYLSTV